MDLDQTPEQHRRSVIHLTLWTIAALLLVLWLVGLGGLIHMAVWTLWVVVLFGMGFGAVALVMWLFTR